MNTSSLHKYTNTLNTATAKMRNGNCGTMVIGPQVRPRDRSYYAVYRTPRVAGAAVNCVMRVWIVAFYYRTMLCIRGTSHGPVSVCLSVRPSQVGVLLKRLNVGSHTQHHTNTR